MASTTAITGWPKPTALALRRGSPTVRRYSASSKLKSIAKRWARCKVPLIGNSARRCGPSQQLPAATQRGPSSGGLSTTGGRRSTIAQPLTSTIAAGGASGSVTVSRCAIVAGSCSGPVKGRSNQTTPTVDGGSVVAGSAGLVSSDIAAARSAPARVAIAWPPAPSSTSTVATVAGSGTALVSSSS